MKIFVELFLVFAKIGVMTFGGGIAMLPMLERELVEKKHWVTEEEILDYFAVGQCTPGIIAVNVATFVGQKLAGIAGGIFGTLGMVFPCLVIIDLIAAVLSNFAQLAVVQSAFAGIRVAVCVLVLNAFIKIAKKSITDIPTAVILVLVVCGSVFTDISPIIFVIVAALAGVVLKNLEVKK